MLDIYCYSVLVAYSFVQSIFATLVVVSRFGSSHTLLFFVRALSQSYSLIERYSSVQIHVLR